MTRKQIEKWLRGKGFHDLMIDEKTLCAYEQLYTNLRANKIPLKDIERLEIDKQGEIRAIFSNGLDYASGYFLEYESPSGD